MSIRVYSGIRLPKLNIEETIRYLGELQEPLTQMSNEAHSRVVAKEVAHTLDAWSVQYAFQGKLSDEVSPESTAHRVATRRVVHEQLICRGGLQQHPGVNCDIKLALYVVPGTHRVQGIVTEENVPAHKFLTSQQGIKDWSFWDNGDPPEGVSKHEWNQRADTWHKAFSSPAKFYMLAEPSILYPDPPAEHYPGWDLRVSLATNSLWHERFASQVESEDEAQQDQRYEQLREDVAKVLITDVSAVAKHTVRGLFPEKA